MLSHGSTRFTSMTGRPGCTKLLNRPTKVVVYQPHLAFTCCVCSPHFIHMHVQLGYTSTILSSEASTTCHGQLVAFMLYRQTCKAFYHACEILSRQIFNQSLMYIIEEICTSKLCPSYSTPVVRPVVWQVIAAGYIHDSTYCGMCHSTCSP